MSADAVGDGQGAAQGAAPGAVPGVDDRSIPVRGSFNLRDLGGLPAAEGVVRRGRIFRSDYPAFALEDPDALARLGLHTVVDLRRSAETEFESVGWAESGIEHVVAGLSAGRESSWHAKYPAYLTHRPETVVAAVRAIIRGSGQPVLFHCAAGKDRTGVVAALLLSLLGVADDVIVADYVLTDRAVLDIMARLRARGPYAEMLADSTDEDQRPRAEVMEAFLEWLRSNGGAEGWLTANGVPAEEIEAFRVDMVDPVDPAQSR
jgi:protein-tyrosine phosphatase